MKPPLAGGISPASCLFAANTRSLVPPRSVPSVPQCPHQSANCGEQTLKGASRRPDGDTAVLHYIIIASP